jgi:hypothetical protein
LPDLTRNLTTFVYLVIGKLPSYKAYFFFIDSP